MEAWWNSLERVSGTNTYVLGFAALFGFLAAVLIIAGWILGNRISDLQQAQLVQFRADADTKIAYANQIAAQANEHAKLLETQTQELKNKNLEIERRINPRFLTQTEQKTILDGIRPHRGHQIIIVRLGDGEAGPYGDSIIAVFQKAEWVVQVNRVGVFSPPTYGVVCRISESPDAAVKAALASLQKAGIQITIEPVKAQQNSWIDMMVGLKPIA